MQNKFNLFIKKNIDEKINLERFGEDYGRALQYYIDGYCLFRPINDIANWQNFIKNKEIL